MRSTTPTEPGGAVSTPDHHGPLLVGAQLSKRYGALQALADVDLDLMAGEVHGLCGHNGAGKSTLVKILTGQVQPDGGTITIGGTETVLRTPLAAQAAGIAVVDQELSLAPDLTLDENVFLGSLHSGLFVHPGRRRERTAELLGRVGLQHLDPRMLAGRLSVGERQLLEIARALGRDARILFLDEPTATLSETEIARVFTVIRELASAGTSVVYISHRLGEVLELCDRVTVVRDGRLVATRAAQDIGSRDALIRMMIGAELSRVEVPDDHPSGDEPTVEIEGLRVPRYVEHFDLTVSPGQIVGITGQVGSGVSEVLRALGGLIPEARGSVRVGGRRVALGSPARALRAGIAFTSNDRKSEGLFLTQPIRTNFVATRLRDASALGLFRPGRARRIAAGIAKFVGVDPKRLPDAVSSLSGGNQQKVFLGRCLDRSDVRLLLFDEPTRGVDVGGRAEIHALLRKAAQEGIAVIYASTEVDEIMELSNVVVTMFSGRIVAIRPRSSVTMEGLAADMTLSHSAAKAGPAHEGVLA